MKEEELEELFANFGSIISKQLKKDGQNRTFAFVCFEKFEDARKAKEELHEKVYKD